MRKHCKEEISELALKPEYIATAEKIHNQPSIKIGTVARLRKKYKR